VRGFCSLPYLSMPLTLSLLSLFDGFSGPVVELILNGSELVEHYSRQKLQTVSDVDGLRILSHKLGKSRLATLPPLFKDLAEPCRV